MIVFENVTKNYNTNVGLDNVSVKIDKGDFVFLVGPSGAGKSTFIKLILKEIDADSGSIKVNGNEITTLSNRQIPKLRRSIGIVFQDFRLLPKKTVFENVAFAMEIIHQSPRQIRRQVPMVLSLVGISSKASKYPSELSAGEQQRVAIARAIVNNPTVLIADEPTGNLDPDTAWEIMRLLEQINRRGTTIVMVTHAKDIVDRMNGTIKLESKENVGTTFTVTIPLEIDHNAEKEQQKKVEKPDLSGKSVLLVEDNELNLEIAKMLLEDEKMVVTTAENGEKAVDIVSQSVPGRFDFIFMDIMMPVMDGLEAARQIRTLNRKDTKEIPIIAMTANAFQDDIRDCIDAGMNAHIAKPIDSKKIEDILQLVLKQKMQ